ncbi:MAG: hypothetical protein GX483_05535 [Actinomycetaceae bacterium]|nr:hypothetical protein [Actinomycetaceae bacterium]
MSVTYLVPISPIQAGALLNEGHELVAGYAVDAAAAAAVTDVSDLLDLLVLRYPNSPFKDDEPLHVLHIPADPFIQARHAVGPLHPAGFRGGIVDFPPFDGTGVARGGGVETDLLYIEPSRITIGSRLWKFTPGSPEPELLGVYHGIAYGWENMQTGTFAAVTPSPFVGPIIQRDWGAIPVQVEIENDAVTAITLVSPINPTDEDGFTQLESGQWAKRIAYTEDLRILTRIFIGEVSGIPVRVLRAVTGPAAPGVEVTDPDQQLMFHVSAVVSDAPYCEAVHMHRWATGTYTMLVRPENLLNHRRQEAVPVSWDMSARPAITSISPQPFAVDDIDQVVQSALALLAQTSPTNWQKIVLRAQVIGTKVIYQVHALLSDDRVARLKIAPTALMHYLRQMKVLRIAAGEAPFFSVLMQINKDGKAAMNVNTDNPPPWADQVAPEDWQRDMELYPRPADQVPDWLLDKLAEAASKGEHDAGAEGADAGAEESATATVDLTAGFIVTEATPVEEPTKQ